MIGDYPMAMINVNIRIDENLKIEFEGLCHDLGLTMTAAFTVFAKAVVLHRGIPFEITLDVPNATTIAALEETDRIIKDPSKSKSYTDVDEMMMDLLSDEPKKKRKNKSI